MGQEKDINSLWEMEQEGVSIDEKCVSLDDKYVLQLWEDNIEIVDGKFQLPIPWKNGGPQLPNNYSMALKRFQSLLARLKGERLFKQYDDQIKKLLDEGYAEFVLLKSIRMMDLYGIYHTDI